MIVFFAPGIPRSGGSKQGYAYTGKDGKTHVAQKDMGDEKVRAWRAIVADQASQAHEGPVLEGPLRFDMWFWYLRPKNHFGTGRNAGVLKASAPDVPTCPPDLTKLVRATEDALKGICWPDDKNVVEQHVYRCYVGTDYGDGFVAERPGARIIIDHWVRRVRPLGLCAAAAAGP